MNLKKIKDSFDTDELLSYFEGISMEEIAAALWDNFGSSWCEDEFDFIVRELVASGDEDDYEFDGYDSFEQVVSYVDANDIFQHLNSDEKESMMEYFGFEDEEDEDDEDEEEEVVYEDEELRLTKDNDNYLSVYTMSSRYGLEPYFHYVTMVSLDYPSQPSLEKFKETIKENVSKKGVAKINKFLKKEGVI